MMEFYIYRDGVGRASGFDTGDMRFVFGGEEVSSQKEPRFRMMIYLSIVSLIDGLLALPERKRFDFVAADSSFSMKFILKKDVCAICSEGKSLGVFDYDSIIISISNGICDFLRKGNSLPLEDSVYTDFNGTVEDLKAHVRFRKG